MLDLQLTIGTAHVIPSSKVRNLCVVMDETLSLVDHISSAVCNASLQVRNISRIRRFIHKTLVHSLVISRLDYANALLYKLPDVQINRLQCVQNQAARLISRTAYRDSITPVFMQLHWLPVQLRTNFKLLCLVYKLLQDIFVIWFCIITPGEDYDHRTSTCCALTIQIVDTVTDHFVLPLLLYGTCYLVIFD